MLNKRLCNKFEWKSTINLNVSYDFNVQSTVSICGRGGAIILRVKTYPTAIRAITTPKCRTSYRDVMMTSDLRKSLFDYIATCKRLAGFTSDLYLFGIDTPIAPTTLDRKKNIYCNLSGVKQIRLHEFRHSHVSLLINNGINDFDISKRLGHSRDMVNNTYGHWFKKSQENLVSKLDRMSESRPYSTSLKN